MDPLQFKTQIIIPTLAALGLPGGIFAADLLLGTALTESGLHYLRQHSDGPALGVYQIEPDTHEDIWANFLDTRPEFRRNVQRFMGTAQDQDSQLVSNLAYATVIARLVYWRKPEPLPISSEPMLLARYWKTHFNTPLGKGKPGKFAKNIRPYL